MAIAFLAGLSALGVDLGAPGAWAVAVVTTTTTAPKVVTTTTTAPKVVTTTTTVPATTTTVPKVVATTTVPSTTTTVPKVVATTTTVPATTTTTVPKVVATTTTVPATTTTTSTTSTTTTTTTVPAPIVLDPTCTTDMSAALTAYLNALPDGSTFQSPTDACYLVANGVTITHPLTVIGGTFYDPITQKPAGTGYGLVRPIIRISRTSNVTLRNLTVVGNDVNGVLHNEMVGEAGVQVRASDHITLTGITSRNTWGDGLELWTYISPGKPYVPDTAITVDGFTSINAGRMGVTVASVSGATLNNINIISPDMSGFDFESDLHGVGSGNITISNCTNDHGFNFVEYLTGPVTVNNCNGFHHITLGSLNSSQPVTFNGGSMLCKRIDPAPCIIQNGGSLTINGTTLGRMAGTVKISEPMWQVNAGGILRLMHSQMTNPFGTTDTGGAITIAP